MRNKKETARKKREEEAKKWKEKHASLREDLHIHHHSHHDHMSPESPPTASTEYSHSHAHASGTAIPSPHPPLVKKMQHVSRFERDKRARKEQEEQHKEKIKKVPELSKDSNSRLLQPTKAHEMKLRKQKEEDEKKSRERKEKESKIIQPMLTFSSPPAKKKRLKDDDIGNDTNPEEDDDMEEGNVTTPLKNSKRGRGENTKLSQGKSKSKSKSKSKRRTPQPPTIGRNANKRSAASPRRNRYMVADNIKVDSPMCTCIALHDVKLSTHACMNVHMCTYRLESIIDELPSPRRRAEEDRKDSGSRKRSKQSGASPRRNRYLLTRADMYT